MFNLLVLYICYIRADIAFRIHHSSIVIMQRKKNYSAVNEMYIHNVYKVAIHIDIHRKSGEHVIYTCTLYMAVQHSH